MKGEKMARGNKNGRRDRVQNARNRFAEIESKMLDQAITVQVMNDWQHWRFATLDHTYDWWPSTGRFVVDGDNGSNMYAKNVDTAMKLVERVEYCYEDVPDGS